MFKKLFNKKVKPDELKLKAEQGDAKCQYLLGQSYEHGEAPYCKNLTLAYRWYQKAALQNYPNAGYRLSLLQVIIKAEHLPAEKNN